MKKHCLFITVAFLLCSLVYSQGLFKGKGLKSFMEGSPAISTNFKDVDMEGTKPPEFGEGATYNDLRKSPRDAEGYFLLRPGFYESTNFSYCLKAGTPGPNVSDGYGLAPLKGKMEEVVLAILVNSQSRWANKGGDSANRGALSNVANAATKISQRDVQLLLWAIIAKADFNQLAGRSKAVALALLTPEQIVQLNGGAFKTSSKFLMDKGIISKPEPIRMIEDAQEKLRALYYRGDATFEDFERAAILAGLSTQPQIAPNRTWFRHPSGCYFIRYEPHGYPRTKFQIYVPDSCPEVKFKATGNVATPDDSRQRLAQTDWFANDELH